MIISTDVEKAFDKTQPLLTLIKVGKEGTRLNIITAIYDKPIVNTILNGKTQKAFLLKFGTRHGCPHSPRLLNSAPEVPATATRQESRVRLCATPQTAAHQAPLSLGFSRQEHWSGLPFPSPLHKSEK